MNTSPERALNQQSFRSLQQLIQRKYPAGRFVAFGGSKVIAEAATFAELESALTKQGQDSADVLVVQAGVEYPESAVIF